MKYVIVIEFFIECDEVGLQISPRPVEDRWGGRGVKLECSGRRVGGVVGRGWDE